MKQKNRPTLIDKCLLWLSTSRRIDGLWVGVFNARDPDIVLQRIVDALDLIKVWHPVKYGQLICDVDRVWARLLPGSLGHFKSSIRSCELSTDFILDVASSPEMIGAVIVHEATHARLDHYGFGYEEKLRPRIEAICLRREIAFAAKLPDGKEIREHAESLLALCSTEHYWTDTASEQRDLAAVRDLGVPDWFIQALKGIREFKLRISRLVR